MGGHRRVGPVVTEIISDEEILKAYDRGAIFYGLTHDFAPGESDAAMHLAGLRTVAQEQANQVQS